jgi:hypothetical protein
VTALRRGGGSWRARARAWVAGNGDAAAVMAGLGAIDDGEVHRRWYCFPFLLFFLFPIFFSFPYVSSSSFYFSFNLFFLSFLGCSTSWACTDAA